MGTARLAEDKDDIVRVARPLLRLSERLEAPLAIGYAVGTVPREFAVDAIRVNEFGPARARSTPPRWTPPASSRRSVFLYLGGIDSEPCDAVLSGAVGHPEHLCGLTLVAPVTL